MEAANRGAAEAGGKTIGLNIRLPFEQGANRYITDGLHFEFHYFFMRKFWFAYLAKALVIFPGGFGTLDEMFEILTLMQTEKLEKQIQIILYGTDYWDPILSLEPMAEWGAIGPADIDLVQAREHAGAGVRAAQGAPDRASPAAADGAGDEGAGDREDAVLTDAVPDASSESCQRSVRGPPGTCSTSVHQERLRRALNAASSLSSSRRSPSAARPLRSARAALSEPARMSIGSLSCSYSYGGWRHANSRGSVRRNIAMSATPVSTGWNGRDR